LGGGTIAGDLKRAWRAVASPYPTARATPLLTGTPLSAVV
jgi:hypothetical protein